MVYKRLRTTRFEGEEPFLKGRSLSVIAFGSGGGHLSNRIWEWGREIFYLLEAGL